MILAILSGIGGAYVYVKTLKADLAVSEANNMKLEQSISEQKAVIEQVQADFKQQQEISKKLQQTNLTLANELKNTEERFNKLNASGKKRDVGALALEKARAIERVINKGTANANRCFEIATGSPLTEKEKNATKKSQINPECPSIANPSFIPYQ
jgi:multidrug resistance efflux pump